MYNDNAKIMELGTIEEVKEKLASAIENGMDPNTILGISSDGDLMVHPPIDTQPALPEATQKYMPTCNDCKYDITSSDDNDIIPIKETPQQFLETARNNNKIITADIMRSIGEIYDMKRDVINNALDNLQLLDNIAINTIIGKSFEHMTRENYWMMLNSSNNN